MSVRSGMQIAYWRLSPPCSVSTSHHATLCPLDYQVLDQKQAITLKKDQDYKRNGTINRESANSVNSSATMR
jgi:hypothetical protein